MDDAELWQLLQTVVANGATAWPALVVELEPLLMMMAKNQPIGRLRDHEDSQREIVTSALGRLHKREFEAIRKLCAIEPKPELRAWLRVIVKRCAIDYMRGSPEYRRGNAQRADRWISLATLSSRAPAAEPNTLAEKRDAVIAFVREAVSRASEEVRAHGKDEAIARVALAWKIDRTHVRRLVDRGQRYLDVLELVLAGNTYPEAGERLGLTTREVELTVRYIEDLLEAREFA